MEDRADQQCMGCLFPMVALFETAFRVHQHVRDVLHVAHLPGALADFEKGIVGGRGAVGRIEQQHPRVPGTKTGGELPVLTLDVMHDGGAGPGQERRHHKTHTLAAPCGRETQHMLRPVVAQIVAAEPPEHHAIVAEQTGGAHFPAFRPARRAIGLGIRQFTRAPYRHGDGDDDGGEPARHGDERAGLEYLRRIGVVAEPPPEEGRRRIDRPIPQHEPRSAKLRLVGERRGGPLCRRPYGCEHDQEDREDLTPEDFGCRHGVEVDTCRTENQVTVIIEESLAQKNRE